MFGEGEVGSPSSEIMKSRFSAHLFWAVSVTAHAVLYVAASASLPEIGKSVRPQIYPIRVHVIGTASDLLSVPIPVANNELQGAGGEARQSPRLGATPEFSPVREEKKYEPPPDRYFAVSELDQKPSILEAPDLGGDGINPMIEGEATLRIFLNKEGRVDTVEIESNTLPDAMMQTLKKKYAELRFLPGAVNGVNVKSVIRYRIELKKAARLLNR